MGGRKGGELYLLKGSLVTVGHCSEPWLKIVLNMEGPMAAKPAVQAPQWDIESQPSLVSAGS